MCLSTEKMLILIKGTYLRTAPIFTRGPSFATGGKLCNAFDSAGASRGAVELAEAVVEATAFGGTCAGGAAVDKLEAALVEAIAFGGR